MVYGGESGPDLAGLARERGLSEADLVGLHAGGPYTVFMLGFTPGFAYLGLLPEALITDPASAAAQALRIVCDHVVTSIDGAEVPLHAETLCLHGDNPQVLAVARAVREALEGAGVSVQALAR